MKKFTNEIKRLEDLHKEMCQTGNLTDAGLCCIMHSIHRPLYRLFLDYFSPSEEEYDELGKEGKSTGFWGSGLTMSDWGLAHLYTELRQNILLLFIEILKSEQ